MFLNYQRFAIAESTQLKFPILAGPWFLDPLLHTSTHFSPQVTPLSLLHRLSAVLLVLHECTSHSALSCYTLADSLVVPLSLVGLHVQSDLGSLCPASPSLPPFPMSSDCGADVHYCKQLPLQTLCRLGAPLLMHHRKPLGLRGTLICAYEH